MLEIYLSSKTDYLKSDLSIKRFAAVTQTKKITINIVVIFFLLGLAVINSFCNSPLYEFVMTNCDTSSNCLNSITTNTLKFKFGDCFVPDSEGNQDQFGCKRILSGYMITPDHSIESEPFSFPYTFNSWTFMVRAFMHFTMNQYGTIPLKFTTMVGDNQGTYSFGVRYSSGAYSFCVHLDYGI